MNRRAFVFSLASFAAALAAIFFAVRRKLRVGDAHVEPRHLYAIRNDESGEVYVYVSTSPRGALATHHHDGRGFYPEPDVTLEDVVAIPDGHLLPYIDDEDKLAEEPAALLARFSPIGDALAFFRPALSLWYLRAPLGDAGRLSVFSPSIAS